MESMEKIQAFLDRLDEKRFYQLLLIFLSFIALAMLGTMFYHYRNVRKLKQQINTVNETREEVRVILDKAQHVKKERKEIAAILAQDPNFKIAGYFQEILTKLGLTNKKASKEEVTTPAQEGQYQESVLNVRFSEMNMKELTQLLQEIEQNQRVFPKELEITASKKTPNSIDVNLTIATLEPRSEEGEGGE